MAEDETRPLTRWSHETRAHELNGSNALVLFFLVPSVLL